MLVKVKICGIRSFEAAQAAVETGADFLGFNFVPTSKRYILPSIAEKIISKVKGKPQIVGVFQNAPIKLVNDLVSVLGLDFVQLHGNENNEYINKVSIPVIKYITMNHQINSIKAAYFLLDRTKRGTGKMVNLKKAADLAYRFHIFYAGGLNPQNVADIIRQVKPFAVDVASGIETDGIQDIKKIRLFIENAKGTI